MRVPAAEPAGALRGIDEQGLFAVPKTRYGRIGTFDEAGIPKLGV
jgi:hypothetical protein